MTQDPRFETFDFNEESDAKAKAECMAENNPSFLCPYDKTPCNPLCLCSIHPTHVMWVRIDPKTYRVYGYRCDNHSFNGE